MLYHAVLWGLVASVVWATVIGCGPSGSYGRSRGRFHQRPRTPFVPHQSEPTNSEFSPFASGAIEGPVARGDPRYYKELVMFTGYTLNDGILDSVEFVKDVDGSGEMRLLTPRCVEKLKALAISVMNQWPGQKLRVVDGWIENVRPGYPNDSLHYEGRAVDITTSDRDRSRIGMLARLAVEAGFDWVYYETKNHIHCSVKSESSQGARTGGCFTSSGTVTTEGGRRKKLSDLQLGEQVLSYDGDTGRLVYSEVLMFLDRDTEAEKQFLRLTLSGGSVLTVTPQHLVMRRRPNDTNVEAVFAARLEPSDELLVSERNGTRLVSRTLLSSELVLEKGVIAPLTSAGTVVVDDVVASCYAVIESQTIAHLAFAPVRAYNSVADVVTATSRFLMSPFSWERPVTERYVNGTAPALSEGVHWYPATLYYLSNHLIPSYLLYSF